MRGCIRRWLGAPALSPAGLVNYGLLVICAFAGAHVAGLRDNTSILSGTSAGGVTATFGGAVYVLLYFAAVVLAPIAALAGLFFALLQIAQGRSRE